MLRILFLVFLLSVLPSEGLAAVRVFNRGIPGQTTAEIDARTADELQTYHPDLVVLFAGMNDAANSKTLLAPVESRLNVQSIIRKCRDAGARVVLVTVHQPDKGRLMQRHKPEEYGNRSPEQRIRDVNHAIVQVGEKERVPVVDFATLLKRKGGATSEWSTDGVHLTAKGYALLATAVFQELQRMGHFSNVLCLGDSLTFGIGVRTEHAAENGETYPSAVLELIRVRQR